MVEQRLKYIVEHIIQAQKCRDSGTYWRKSSSTDWSRDSKTYWCRGPAPTYVKTRRSRKRLYLHRTECMRLFTSFLPNKSTYLVPPFIPELFQRNEFTQIVEFQAHSVNSKNTWKYLVVGARVK
jgi:hypothetical protein